MTQSKNRRFELKDGRHSKFWEVAASGPSVIVRFGRIGSTGIAKSTKFSSPAAAGRAAAKLIEQKTRKGYREVRRSFTSTRGPAGSGGGPTARLATVWREKRPGFEQRLRPGARASAITKFAKLLGVKLPPAFLAFYAWHDGAKDEHVPFEGKYGWFSLAGILEHKRMLDSHPEPEVHASWSTAWIPFLQENYSDLICLDTRSGVVFERFNYEPKLLLLAPSFDAWLAAHVAISEAALSLSEDDVYDAFHSASARRIRAKISPGFPRRAAAKSLVAH